jgi:hypothetical protein
MECEYKIKPECKDKFSGIDLDLDKVMNPNNGALAIVHDRITDIEKNKASWKIVLWMLGFMILLSAGAYGYSTMSVGNVSSETKSLISEMKQEARESRKELLEAIRELRK